jgi:hypothetical protein
MNIRKKDKKTGKKELLLKEYFLNAYLIALLKQAGNEVALRRKVSRASSEEQLPAT